MNQTARTTAQAQVAITVVFMVGYFSILYVFLAGVIRTPPTWRDMLLTLLGVITGGMLTILNFWFSRARGQEKPDAS